MIIPAWFSLLIYPEAALPKGELIKGKQERTVEQIEADHVANRKCSR